MTPKKDFSKLPSKKTKRDTNKETKNHLSRLIKMMITLDNGVLNLDRMAEECGVSRRTIVRDIKILQGAGLPLYKPNEQNANYRLEDGFHLSKFHVTKENARDFVDEMDVLLKFAAHPVKWTLPIQEEVVKLGRNEQKRRAKRVGKLVPINATKENVISSFLDQEEYRKSPLNLILILVALNQFADDKTFKNSAFRKWQMRELQKTFVRFNWLNQQHAEALQTCRELIQEDPEEAEPYRQAALICYTQKDYKGALKYASEGLSNNKEDETLHTYTIYFAILNKQYEQAIKLFNVYFEHPQMRVHFAALMYAWVGLFDKALTVVEQAVKNDPDGANIYAQMKVQVLEMKNEKEKKS